MKENVPTTLFRMYIIFVIEIILWMQAGQIGKQMSNIWIDFSSCFPPVFYAFAWWICRWKLLKQNYALHSIRKWKYLHIQYICRNYGRRMLIFSTILISEECKREMAYLIDQCQWARLNEFPWDLGRLSSKWVVLIHQYNRHHSVRWKNKKKTENMVRKSHHFITEGRIENKTKKKKR